MSEREQSERVATGDTTPWIAAINPCDRECPGWAVFETERGLEIQRCDDCWRDDPCPPDDSYYQSRPECIRVLELGRQHVAACSLARAKTPGACVAYINATVGDWPAGEQDAWRNPIGREWPLVCLVTGYAVLADTHRADCGVKLGDDAHYQDSATDLVRALVEALHLGTGRLDHERLGSLLRDLAELTDAEI